MKKSLYVLSFSLLASFGALAQDTKIGFFGQPEFGYETRKTTGFQEDANIDYPTPLGLDGLELFDYVINDSSASTSRTNFNTGNFVLFITSQVTDRISVLSENSARYNTTSGDFNFTVQRLMVRYYWKDAISFRAGKMFTPVGYWNNQYNLGLVLQPTISRPLIIRPQNEGGVINVADVGLQVEGDNITKARLFYRAMIGNGSGFFGANDKNSNHVASYFTLGSEIKEGLRLSVSAMFDEIRKGTENLSGVPIPDNGDFAIYNVSLSYMNPEKKAEFIGEFYTQTTSFDSAGTKQSTGFFGYAGYKVTPKIVPYVVYNYSLAGVGNDADTYYSPVPITVQEGGLGVRYKVNSNFVAKFEYQFYNEQQLFQTGTLFTNAYAGLEDKTITNLRHGPKVQLAFGF